MSYEVHQAACLLCKKCHSGKFFEDILADRGIHCVEAILTRDKDPTHNSWLRRHAANKHFSVQTNGQRAEQEELGHGQIPPIAGNDSSSLLDVYALETRHSEGGMTRTF